MGDNLVEVARIVRGGGFVRDLGGQKSHQGDGEQALCCLAPGTNLTNTQPAPLIG